MIKTKQELLNHFSDINEMYNNPFMYQTLSNMIDELLEQQPCEDCKVKKEAYIQGYDYGVKDWFKSKSQPCEDAISREDAIREIQDKYGDNAVGIDIVDIVAHLPSVRPCREIVEDKRACEKCIHYVTRDSRGVVLCGCDSWECDFEEVKT